MCDRIGDIRDETTMDFSWDSAEIEFCSICGKMECGARWTMDRPIFCRCLADLCIKFLVSIFERGSAPFVSSVGRCTAFVV